MIRDFGLLLAVGIAVICVASIVAAAGRSSASASTGRRPRAGTSATARWPSWSCGSATCPRRPAVPLAVASVVVFAGGILVEDQLTIQSDPEEWVNQDTQVIRDIDTLKRETGSSAELGIFVESDDVFSDETVDVRHRLRQRAARRPARRPAHGVVDRDHRGFLLEVPGTTRAAAHRRADVERGLRGGAARHPEVARSTPRPAPLNLVFRTGPGSLERAGRVRRTRSATSSSRASTAGGVEIPPGVRATPSGLAVVGVGLLENIESNRILLTYLAVGVRVPVPGRAAAQRRAGAAVDGAGAHRRGRGVAGGVGVRPPAQPDDRGRRTARRRRCAPSSRR